jgi:IPT/TIG domain
MTNPLSLVRAGDLIRADEINLFITAHNDLEARVALLESGGTGSTTGAPVIEAVTPVTPRVGDTVVVSGRDFDYSIGAANLSVDGIDCPLLIGSADTVLVFLMPELAGLPTGGRNAELQVQNLRLSAIRTVRVLPELTVPQGNVELEFEGTKPERITLNQPCVFTFQAISTSNVPVRITLQPLVSVGAWQAALQVLDELGDPLPRNELTVASMKRKEFAVRVAQVTSAASTFTLTVNGAGSGLTTSSGARSFTVGQVGTQDRSTGLDVVGVVRGGPGGEPYDEVTETITLKTGEGAEVDFLARFSKAGDYKLTSKVTPSGSGWAVNELPTGFEIDDGDIPTDGADAGWAKKAAQFVVKAPGTPGRVELALVLKGTNPAPRQLTLNLIAQP